MALFGRKKKEEKVEVADTKVKATPAKAKAASASAKTKKVRVSNSVEENIARVLVSPRITEKATEKNEKGVYVFNVTPDSNKKQIEKAVRALYKVEPRKVRVVNIPRKKVRNARTGMEGIKGGGKKAYVYLKDGDSISVM